jgi:CBS domain-containing protein
LFKPYEFFKKYVHRDILLIASSPVVTIGSDAPVVDAVRIMCGEGFRRLPVTDPRDRRLVGILVASDIIEYLDGGDRFQGLRKELGEDIKRMMEEAVGKIMAEGIVSIGVTATLTEAIKLMREKNLGCLPITDGEGRVWAILTERDIMVVLSRKMRGLKVSGAMTKDLITIQPEATIMDTMEEMTRHGFRRLPLVSEGRVEGIVTAMDVIRYIGHEETLSRIMKEGDGKVFLKRVEEIAVKDLVTITPSADISDAASLMIKHDIGSLLVAEDNRLLGLVTERDLFKIIPL